MIYLANEMALWKKNQIYPVVLILVVFAVWKWRQADKLQFYSISGTTFGTIAYNITYSEQDGVNYKESIDSLLKVFNRSLNHYQPESELSQFNADTIFEFNLPYFHPVLKSSKHIYEQTSGAFDPSIGHLINAWGFGPGEPVDLDSQAVDSLKRIVYFKNVEFDNSKVWKLIPELRLDFSAIAKGYGIDVVSEYLELNGVENYFVEIGGEIRCKGSNQEGVPWKIGIIDPQQGLPVGEPLLVAQIGDRAVATSANNFNYFERDGKRIVHTLDPISGYPVEHNLLSASVIADDCMTADGFATAFMVMGLESAKEVLAKNPDLDAILVFDNDSGGVDYFITENIEGSVLGPE